MRDEGHIYGETQDKTILRQGRDLLILGGEVVLKLTAGSGLCVISFVSWKYAAVFN